MKKKKKKSFEQLQILTNKVILPPFISYSTNFWVMEENRRNSYINYIEINDVSSAIISQGVTLNKKEKKKNRKVQNQTV